PHGGKSRCTGAPPDPRPSPTVTHHGVRARASPSVTRAIRAAMAKLACANPSLGQHLVATIRTGRYCSYTRPRSPDHLGTVTWQVVAGTRRAGGRVRQRLNNGACPLNAPAGEGAPTGKQEAPARPKGPLLSSGP